MIMFTTLQLPPPAPKMSSSRLLVFSSVFDNPSSPVSHIHKCMAMGSSIEHGKPTSGHTLKKECSSLPQKQLATNSCLVRGETDMGSSPIYAGVLAGLVWCR